MENQSSGRDAPDLPSCAMEFIRQVVRKMGYRRKARAEVEAELAAHVQDELRGLTDANERERKAQTLIEQFGDVKLLAVLCRRAKKRCRPLWAKAVVRSLQAAGALLLLFGFYMIWFVNGRPVVEVDYLAILNLMSRPEIADRDNAWPHYEQAIALAIECPPELLDVPPVSSRYRVMRQKGYRDFTTFSREVQDAIRQWVHANGPAWEQMVLASSAPYLYKLYEAHNPVGEPWLLSVKLPGLRSLRQLAFIGMWRSRIHQAEKRTAEAVDDCLVLARVGRHWQHAEVLIEQLVGLAIAGIAHDEILLIVQQQDLSEETLADLQRELAGVYAEEYPLIDIESERLSFLDTVQRVFTDGGPGGGHLIPSALASLSTITGGSRDELTEMPFPGTALSLVHAGRDETVAKGEELFRHQKELSRMTPYEKWRRQVTTVDQMLDALPEYRYALLGIMMPALDRAVAIGFRGRTIHEATLTILALQRYHRDNGQYPISLDALCQAGYIDSVPTDPYSDGPLSYKTANGTFVLYSLGPDFDDDHGVASTDRKGLPDRWGNEGDTVFWPAGP
jgi:hypothetical protein